MKTAKKAVLALLMILLSSCVKQPTINFHDCENGEEYLALALQLKEQGNLNDAEKAFKKAIKIAPEDTTEAKILQSIDAQLEIAQIYLERNDPSTARKWTRASLKLASRKRDVLDWPVYLQIIKDKNKQLISAEETLMRHARLWSVARWGMLAVALIIAVIFAAMYLAIRRSYKLLLANEKRWAGSIRTSAGSAESDLYKKIVEHIESSRCYLDPSLRIEDVAAAVSSNRSYVSNAINENKVNFSSFINEYRVKEAIRMMSADKTLKVEYVASACGFGNRNSFTEAFKSITGFTPTKFRQEL